MKYHPASELFPLMEGEEFEEFKKDIEKKGCREPIVILDEMILDGRNRWRACEELGINPPIKEWCSDESPVEFVISMNLHRRHLSPEQKAYAIGNQYKLEKKEHGGQLPKRDGSK